MSTPTATGSLVNDYRESSLIFFLFSTTELTGRRNKSAVMGLKDCRVLPLLINQ